MTMPTPRARRLLAWALLLLLCGGLMFLRWNKLLTLVWGDPPRWLHEYFRAAHGELPYRDFSWQYAPFSIYLFAWPLRWFGVSFNLVQTIIDSVSLAVVGLCALLTGLLFPSSLRFPVVFFIIATCGTSLLNFNLFSMATYMPAIQVGAAGALLVLAALVRYQRSGRLGYGGTLAVAAGSFIGVLSKPEFALAIPTTLGVLALTDRWRWFSGRSFQSWLAHYALLAAGCGLPALAVYAALAAKAGTTNLLMGLSGYGLATFACPWWPTGVGVFGALAALGEGLFLRMSLSLAERDQLPDSRAPRYRRLWYGALAGLAVFLAFVAYLNQDALTASLPLAERARRILPSVIYTSPLLLPVMWWSVLYWLWLMGKLLKGLFTAPQWKAGEEELLLWLTMPSIMSIRSLFGTTLTVYPEVAAVCYPFYLILGPYLLLRRLNGREAAWPQRSSAIVGAALILYGVGRLVAAYPAQLSGRSFGVLETNAGKVKVAGYALNREIYDYLARHTQPGDYVLDIPYGGGMNFALGRRSPIFSTQLSATAMPARYQEQDLRQIKRSPPAVIIAEDKPHLGASYGYGISSSRSCVFPRLVWAPDALPWEPDYEYPLVGYIKAHYRVDRKVDGKLLLVPRQGIP